MRQQMVMSFLLLMGVAGIAGRVASQERNATESAHCVATFLAADIPGFKIQNLDLEHAMEALREAVTKHTSASCPAIGVIRYSGNPSTVTNPWQMRESISLSLEKCSAADVLHYLAEASGFLVRTDRWRVELYEVPVLRASQSGSLAPNLRDTLGMREFMKLNLPQFRCENAPATEAVRILRETAAKVSGKQCPPVAIIRYRKADGPVIDEEKRAWPVNLDIKDVPAAEALRYIGELSGCRTEFRDTCMVISELPMLYHPKDVRQFQLKELEAAWGKASKPVESWLQEKLDAAGIPSMEIGYNERTGEVFVTAAPEYMGAILRGPENKSQGGKKAPQKSR